MQHKADCSSDESSTSDDEVDSEDDHNDMYDVVAPRRARFTRNALRRNVRFKNSVVELPPSPRQTDVVEGDQEAETDDAGPLSPWNDKCKSKQKIITALKDKESPIHQILDNINEIHRLYAPRYQLRRFKHIKMELHKTAVESVCVLIAYDQENGRPVFDA